MRNLRWIILLTLGIVLLVAAELLLGSAGVRVSDMRDTLLPYLGEVDGVIIERRGGEVTALEKHNSWRMLAPFGSAAEGQKVMRLIDGLMLTPVQDSISESEMAKLGRRYEDFSIEHPIAKVTLVSDRTTNTVAFGSITPDGGGVYVMVNDHRSIFCMPVELLNMVELPSSDFRLHSVFNMANASIVELDFKNGIDKNVVFSKTGNGWVCMDKAVAESAVNDLLSAIRDVEIKDFVWPVGSTNETDRVTASLLSGYGLDAENSVVISLRGTFGDVHKLALGKDADGSSVYALIHDGEAIATVPNSVKAAIVRKVMDVSNVRQFPLDRETVAQVTIVDNAVTYILTKDTAEWRMESPIIAPADNGVVEALIDRLLALRVGANEGARVLVSLSTNAVPAAVPASAVWSGITAESLRSKALLQLNPASVRRLVRTLGAAGTAAQSIVFDNERKTWNVEKGSGIVAQANLKAILTSLSALTATKVVALKVSAAKLDDYGLDHPFLTLSIDLEGAEGVRKNLLIGAETAGGRFATIGSSDAIFVLSNKVLDSLLKPIVE